MQCARHNSATGTPPSACRRIAIICASVYLLVFIQNLLMHLAEKILLMQPLSFGGGLPDLLFLMRATMKEAPENEHVKL